MLTGALLDNAELQKKTTENINRVIHKPGPGESLENSKNYPFSCTFRDPGSAETYPMATGCNSAASSCDDVTQELKQAAFETIRELIEHDRLYETLLDETIGIVQP